MRGPRRTWAQRLVLLLNVVLIVLAIGMAGLLRFTWTRAASVTRVQLSSSLTSPKDDEAGRRVMNVLLVGSDSSAGLDSDNPINEGRVGERNGDVVIVAHLDERDGTAALLSFPRDLWVTIAGTEREAKLNAAFAIGGPATLIDTIELNFGIPIHAYVNVDFAGFEGLVEAVGAVEVFFPTPARDWNPIYQRTQTGFRIDTAGCHALGPEQALAYVRSRYYQTMGDDGRWATDPTSDLGRIRRQQDFLQRLMRRAIDLGARNPFVLRDLIDTGLDNVTIDQALTPQLLLDLGRAYRSFEPDELESYSFPATFGEVDSLSVLFPLEDEAAPLLALFAGARSDDPATVRVRVVPDPDEVATSDELIAALADQGFDVDLATSTGIPEVPTIRYGLDGDGARRLVEAALISSGVVAAGDLVPEQSSGLLGRDVVILLPSTTEPGAPDGTTTADGASGAVEPGADGKENTTSEAQEPRPEADENNDLDSDAAQCG